MPKPPRLFLDLSCVTVQPSSVVDAFLVVVFRMLDSCYSQVTFSAWFQYFNRIPPEQTRVSPDHLGIYPEVAIRRFHGFEDWLLAPRPAQ